VIEANMTLLDEDALTPPEPVAPAGPRATPEADTEEAPVTVSVKDMAAFHRFMAKRKAD